MLMGFNQAKKQVSYAESDSEGEDNDEEIFRPSRKNSRASKRRKVSPESDDDFEREAQNAEYSDDGQLRRSCGLCQSGY